MSSTPQIGLIPGKGHGGVKDDSQKHREAGVEHPDHDGGYPYKCGRGFWSIHRKSSERMMVSGEVWRLLERKTSKPNNESFRPIETA